MKASKFVTKAALILAASIFAFADASARYVQADPIGLDGGPNPLPKARGFTWWPAWKTRRKSHRKCAPQTGLPGSLAREPSSLNDAVRLKFRQTRPSTSAALMDRESSSVIDRITI